MSCNLKDTVGRGVDNQFSGAQMLNPVIYQHLRAGIGLVAEDTLPGKLRETIDNLRRKSSG